MNKGNVFKTVFVLLLVVFLVMFISNESGYYDYFTHKKVELTEEQIKQFEEDIKNGKDVSHEDYLVDSSKDYDNKMSKLGSNVSKTITNIAKKGIELTFGALEKLLKD